VEKILLNIFFVFLIKRETHPHNARLVFLRYETHVISVRLPSTCACMISKFSLTSPIIAHVH
jgi:hypothetical protein